VSDNLKSLRDLIKAENIDFYVVPTSDYHSSEYVGDHFRAREFLSGFTGSNGTLLVTADYAALWTDGRYFLQAEEQLKGTGIELMKMRRPGVLPLHEYIAEKLQKDMTLAFDGRVFSVTEGDQLEKAAIQAGAHIRYDADLVSVIWKDRPALSCSKIFILEEKYAGASASGKLEQIRKVMKEKECDLHVVTSLDDIAWTLNLRGNDVQCNPVFLSYLLISSDGGILFVQDGALTDEVRDYLSGLNIGIRPYDSIYGYVADNAFKGKSILIDKNRLNYLLYRILVESENLVEEQNPSVLMKACKNPVEAENLRKANIIDGVAMVRFLHWIDTNIGKTHITEISAADKLEEFRSEGEGFLGISFETISGYNAHGAIIHYEPTSETDVELHPEGFLLVDSGAQYRLGTTDITRTIALGELSQEMKHHYTMVLRAHIDLARAHFPEGVSGSNLDMLSRAPFWAEDLDYEHGTGHGIGYFLNVHEPPASIFWSAARKSCTIPLKEGMLLSDEPGIYIEGEYGIRIENDVMVVKGNKNVYGQFMHFEPMTLCPYDLRPVIREELNDDQIRFINEYHAVVKEKLMPYLDKDTAAWLENATKL
ncbi:MAG: aminopeptidase P family protein, partial [Lachnospiraceae bacterium]|nr:aminopeptidase P family protein [Lachnospiraceae bacterium]